MKNTSFAAVILSVLAGLTVSGCVSMMAPSPHMKDAVRYVHEHKGEGARHVLLGTEALLIDEAVGVFEGVGYVVVREPHALFVTPPEGKLAYAFYFTPKTSDRTEIEALIASNWLTAEQVRTFQNDAFPGYFPIAYLNTRLQEADFDPNAKVGTEGWGMLPLSMAALYNSNAVARRLMARGANVDPALADMKERVELRQKLRAALEKNADKKTMDQYERDNVRFDAAIALLGSLKGDARQVDGTSARQAPAAAKAAGGKGDIADRLRKLEELKTQGLVTEDEYKRKKQELLDQL